ncbi:Signal peptidase I [Brevibacillus laterosporus]|nr:signal peptidase I [Brevibacillus laterosporus]RAP27045.1 Signal peptidase I [Brevibacillus laterosporus]
MRVLMILMVLLSSAGEFRSQSSTSVFIIEGNSMAPFLKAEDKFVVDKGYYAEHSVQRGDVIIFNVKKNKMHVKRVVGIPGDTVQSKEDVLYINGKPIDEPYLSEYKLKEKQDGNQFTYDFGPFTIPQESVFVLGDNRVNSADSREYGPIEIEKIKGKMIKKWSNP